MGPEVIVATLVPLSFFALIFGIIYTRNRENMALIEKGFNPRQGGNYRPRPFVSLKYGLLMIGSGAGLLAAYLIDSLVMHTHATFAVTATKIESEDNPALYFALIGIGGGIGLVLSYVVEKKEWLDKKSQVSAQQ